MPMPPSPRELRCLHLLAHGSSPKEIAYDLDLKVVSVDLYLSRVRAKLNAKSLPHAVFLASQQGLLR
ncbi:DNA-binding CsgD family transcriptional regulator [Nitrospirillum viridazoti]|uniref:DNA-binding CsgD family transcriptional regulator n=3 Tax=Nitrospirillum TaxID=1543705 RepID=A0A560IAR3_9PROT|nr:DNA-binding CsgD family transcriptional regulator [Nitrospirillum amazonense]